MSDWLGDLGINLKYMVAGGQGGLVSALFTNRLTAGAFVIAIIGGAITANYLIDITIAKVTWLSGFAGAAGFILGVATPSVVRGIVGRSKTIAALITKRPS